MGDSGNRSLEDLLSEADGVINDLSQVIDEDYATKQALVDMENMMREQGDDVPEELKNKAIEFSDNVSKRIEEIESLLTQWRELRNEIRKQIKLKEDVLEHA